jgi:hypothetical protein
VLLHVGLGTEVCWWTWLFSVDEWLNGHNIVDYFIKHLDSGSHTCTSLFETPNSGYLSCRIHCLCYGIYQNNPFRNDLSHTLSFGHLNTDPIKPVMCLVLLVFFMRKKCKQHILQMTSWRTKHLGLYSWFLPINSHDFWSAISGYFLQIWWCETISIQLLLAEIGWQLGLKSLLAPFSHILVFSHFLALG